MKKYLYSESDERKISVKIKKDVFICLGLVVAAIAVGIITCNLVTDDNATMLKIINIIMSSVCLCTTAYFILNRIIPGSAKRDYVERMLYSKSNAIRGKVIGDGKKITAMKRIDLIELRILNAEGKELVLYWDAEIDKPDFVGHIIEFYVVNNKIIGYGDADETSN